MQTTPALDAELSKANPLVFGAIRIDLNDGRTIKLIDGAAALVGGDWATYLDHDATFGTIAAIDSFDDGVGDDAPGLGLTLTPASDAAAGDLSAPGMQGSRTRCWIGAVAQGSGAVIADPMLLFDGLLDIPTLTVDQTTRELEFTCASGFERYFADDEGQRLSDAFHRSIWPAETGLANVTGVTRRLYWGTQAPASVITTVSSGAGATRYEAGNAQAL